MIWYYLIPVILGLSGTPPATINHAYPTMAECQQAGADFTQTVLADSKVKQAAWECLTVDFDVVDPVPSGPEAPPEKKPHIPGKDEA